MALADEFARLVANSNMKQSPHLPAGAWEPKNQSRRTETVYSVGEAIARKEQSRDAKLAAGSIGNSG
jgi:hypothetical protein